MIYIYSVAIVEDESVYSQEQERICREIFQKLNIEYSISVFETVVEFETAFQDGTRYDLMLLDIVVHEDNGMKLAERIREYDADGTIIFITCEPGYAIQGYSVNALHYLMKPLDSDVLEKLIVADYEKRFQKQYLTFKSGTEHFRMPINDIICLETVGRYTEIVLPDRTIKYHGTVENLLQRYEQLVRCHKSFAINMRNIRQLTSNDAIAINGKKIPVSRKYHKDVERALLRELREG